MIRFRCTECKQLMGVADSQAGRHVTCPNCQAKVLIPKTAAQDKARPPAPKGASPPASAKQKTEREEVLDELEVMEDDVPEVLPADEEDIEEVESPRRRFRPARRRRRRRSAGADLSFLTTERICEGFLVLFGGGLFLWALDQMITNWGYLPAYKAAGAAGVGLVIALLSLIALIRS